MYQAKKLTFDWTIILVLGEILAIAISMPLAFEGLLLAQPWWGGNASNPHAASCVAYGILLLYLLRQSKLYTWNSFLNPRRASLRIIGAVLLAVVIFVAARYFFGEENARFYRRWLLIHSVVTITMLVGMRYFIRFLLIDVLKLIPIERIAFIGWDTRMERVLNVLKNEPMGFQQVVGFFHEKADLSHEPAFLKKYQSLGTFKEITRKLDDEEISLLIVEEASVSPTQIQKLSEMCGQALVSLKIIPSAFDVWATKLNLSLVAGVPLLGIHDLPLDRYYNRVAKRTMDLAGAIVGLIGSIPVIVVLAYLIKRESPGPIFFRQTRLGLQGEPFQIIKLRSMKLDAEVQTGAVWAVEDDPRRLKIGAFMRKWNLDELPQFWNVLKGEMSLVGPRPERPEFVEGFKETIRYYNMRHSCKPGVTGWAAVNGLRGNTSLEDRLEYDLFYIENWNLWFDFQILALTLLPPKNAY